MAAWLGTGDDMGVVVEPVQVGQDLQRRTIEQDGALTGLAVGQVEAATLEVDFVPA